MVFEMDKPSMKHLFLFIFTVTFLSLNLWAQNTDKSCRSVLALKLGFTMGPAGQLKLQVGQSKYKFVESTVNSLAQILLGKALKLDELSLVTGRFLNDTSSDPYFVKLARAFDLSVKIENQSEFIKNIPKEGGVIVLMNHPANGRETLALAAAVSMVRSDLKVALLHLLQNYPSMSENAVFLNPSPSPEATAYNKGQRAQMDDWVKEGHVLLAHPSGEVSTLHNSQDGVYPKDPQWRLGIAKLVESNPQAKVVLAFMDGQASPAFLRVRQSRFSFVRNDLSPIFHIRELANGQGESFPVNISAPIEGQALLTKFNGKLKEMMAYLRARTYTLKGRFEKKIDNRKLEPIGEVTPPGLVTADLDKMRVLLGNKGLQVLYAQGKDIPHALRELGRLREINFRRVGEGSGNAIDIDQYDPHYYHLIVYKPDSETIMGGYRLSFNDQTIAQQGFKGIYNLNFFEYEGLLQKEFKDSIELGRSFVNFYGIEQLPEKDRRIAAFFLQTIWKGICQVVKENPRYTRALGPMSIPNGISDVSKKIMVDFLMKNKGANEQNQVRPRHGFNPQLAVLPEAKLVAGSIQNLFDLFQVVKDIDGEELPTLIKSYDGLGARYLGFDFDQNFNTVDGMVVVDFLKADPKELSKYFGEEELKAYRRYHGLD
jgi:hypothetical protein